MSPCLGGRRSRWRGPLRGLRSSGDEKSRGPDVSSCVVGPRLRVAAPPCAGQSKSRWALIRPAASVPAWRRYRRVTRPSWAQIARRARHRRARSAAPGRSCGGSDRSFGFHASSVVDAGLPRRWGRYARRQGRVNPRARGSSTGPGVSVRGGCGAGASPRWGARPAAALALRPHAGRRPRVELNHTPGLQGPAFGRECDVERKIPAGRPMTARNPTSNARLQPVGAVMGRGVELNANGPVPGPEHGT